MPPQTRGEVKGGLILATPAFVEHRFGAEARGRFLSSLPPADRQATAEVISVGWYPIELLVRGLHVLEKEFGKGDLSIVTERGAWTAVRDMTTLRKSLLKLVTPPWLVSRAAGFWATYHSSGSWTVTTTGPKTAIASVKGLAVVDPALCATIRGWMIGLGSLTESKCHVKHLRCRSKGAEMCDYQFDWV